MKTQEAPPRKAKPVTIDEWLQRQDRAVETLYRRRQHRNSAGPARVAEAARSEDKATSLDLFLRIQARRLWINQNSAKCARIIIESYLNGRLDLTGHRVEVLRRITDRGPVNILIVDGQIEAECPA
jgi:hypothetical protein